MWSEGSWRALLAVAVLSSGCARIKATTTYTHTPISRRSSMEVVAGSLEYGAKAQLLGQTLQLAFHRVETCRTTAVPVLRKEAHTRREVVDDPVGLALSPTASLVTALLFLGLGGYSYAAAEDLAASDSNTEESTPDDYRGGGLLLGGAGVGFLGVALIDALRLRDSDELVGEVDGPPEVSAELCHRAAAAALDVTVRAPRSKWTASVTTDAGGKARVELLTLDEAAFAGGALALEAELAGHRVPLELTPAQSEPLFAQLAVEPTSRISQERAQRRAAACDLAIASARAAPVDATTTDAAIARLEEAWKSAHRTCGDLWKREHAEAEADFQAKLEATTAARARAQALSAAVDELEANLSSDDAIAVRAQLRDPDLAAALRRDPQAATYVLQIAERWIGAMEAGSSGAGVRAQLCAARALVLSFAGKARWTSLRAQVAQRNDVVKAALLVRAMDGGGCQ